MLLVVNLSNAQFICTISTKVKEAGDAITQLKSHKEDGSLIGDYRENGSGWVFLPNHIGAFFLQNIQVNELVWALTDTEKGLLLDITSFKKGLDFNGKIEIEKENLFLVNIKNEMTVELLNNEILQTLYLNRIKLDPNVKYAQIVESNLKEDEVNELFSSFSKKYVDKKIKEWETKSEFEKTSDWEQRVNNTTKEVKIAELKDEAVDVYAKSEMRDVMGTSYNDNYFREGKYSGKYDADNEVYILKVSKLGEIKIPIPVNEAKKFDAAVKDDNIGSLTPFDMIYFIKNDKLALAEAKFRVGFSYSNKMIYSYINPDAKDRKKTKKEIERENDQQAKQQLLQAENYYSNKDYKQAIAFYQKVISLNPNIMGARNYNALGNAYFFTEDYSQVILSFKKAIALNLDLDSDEGVCQNFYYHLGVAYHKLNDYSNAISAYNESMKCTSDIWEKAIIYNLIAQAYSESKDYFQSLLTYKTLLSIEINQNDRIITFNNISAVYNKQGDYSTAIKILESVIKIDSKMARSYYNLGNAYKGQGDQKKAIKSYKKAANLGDKDAQSTLKEQGIKW